MNICHYQTDRGPWAAHGRLAPRVHCDGWTEMEMEVMLGSFERRAATVDLVDSQVGSVLAAAGREPTEVGSRCRTMHYQAATKRGIPCRDA